jgi:hypothetical protein
MGHSWRLRLQPLRRSQHFFGVAASIGLARRPDSGSDMKTLFGLVAANLRKTFDQKQGRSPHRETAPEMQLTAGSHSPPAVNFRATGCPLVAR